MANRRAIISVSDKNGIAELSKELVSLGYEIISTGGTARHLTEAGITVTAIETVTGFPEIMNGRVKTLHPKIHGGLLCVRNNDHHQLQMKENGIEPIDMVVVNLYPFRETIQKSGVTLEEAIENIDIGGPTMIRSAAKNYRYVTVVTDPADYDIVLTELRNDGRVAESTRLRLAWKVFQLMTEYNGAIADYLEDFASNG